MSKVIITIEERETDDPVPPTPLGADPLREPVPIRFTVEWDPPFDTNVPLEDQPQTHQAALVAVDALRNDPLHVIDTMTAEDDQGNEHVRYRKGGQG